MQVPSVDPSTAPSDVAPVTPPSAAEALGMIRDKLLGWGRDAIELLPNIVVALLVLVAFWLLARGVRRLLGMALERTPMPVPVRRLLLTVTGLGVLGGGLFVALGVLGLDKTVTSLLAGVGILGLALGFASQDLASNLMSGVLLSIRRPINVGDIVEIEDRFGTVQEVNLRATVVRLPDGPVLYVPNKDVLESALTNYSRSGRRRVDLECGVAYGDDLDKVREVALEAVAGVEGREEGREPELFFSGFGESSIDFVVRFWVPYRKQSDYLAARSAAVMAVKRAFDENGITIPFPIRTLDFGVVGGEPLREHLRPSDDA